MEPETIVVPGRAGMCHWKSMRRSALWSLRRWRRRERYCRTLVLRAVAFSAWALALSAAAMAQDSADWRTDYEKSGCTASPDFAATVAYLNRLASASPWIRVETFGVTPQGRALPIAVLSRDGSFTPEQARAAGAPVVLIMAGIHAGEIDGKDAGLMLLRDIAVARLHPELAEHAVILFIPIFNLDGHERRGRFNRLNQNGPVETGWRTTARNLNLNRDFLKADAPEMRAWLRLFNAWLPDLVVDIHVTDGIDFQYNLTYSMEMYANAPARIVAWQKALERRFIADMQAQGDPVFPYVVPREDNDLSRGLTTFASPPRLSTGYVAVRNRAALLVETHMLKPYRERVTATYRLLVSVLAFIAGAPSDLREAVRLSDEETAAMALPGGGAARLPLQFDAGEGHTEVEFAGWESRMEHSDVSGGSYQVWDHSKPRTVRVSYYNDVRPTLEATVPVMYVIPAEWTDVIDRLRCHGVRMERLTRPVSLAVRTYRITGATSRPTPYEGRHPVQLRCVERADTILYPAGTVLLRLAQPSAKVAMHLLEPENPESFAAWGFFDAVLEQKEYFEDYIMEGIAADMLASDAELRRIFRERLASDSAFAASSQARLQFFYERSPYWDAKKNVYPVARCMDHVALPAEFLMDADAPWERQYPR